MIHFILLELLKCELSHTAYKLTIFVSRNKRKSENVAKRLETFHRSEVLAHPSDLLHSTSEPLFSPNIARKIFKLVGLF